MKSDLSSYAGESPALLEALKGFTRQPYNIIRGVEQTLQFAPPPFLLLLWGLLRQVVRDILFDAGAERLLAFGGFFVEGFAGDVLVQFDVSA